MGADNKTEQATPRRRQKAREKGQVARSRDLSSALALFGALMVLSWQAPKFLGEFRQLMAQLLNTATFSELHVSTPLLQWSSAMVFRWVGPPALAGFVLATAGTFAQGGFVFAPSSLAFKSERINPAGKLGQMFSTAGISGMLKSLLPVAVILYVTFQILLRDWGQVAVASCMGVRPFMDFLLGRAFEVAWKSGLVLLLWSAADYMLIRQKMERDLRMSREEIREEVKESEGNPTVKGRIRRLQRQVRRRRMLQDVQRASVVITNPTHFAIALEYKPDMPAPIVVAKGQNMLAQQIKQAALWQGIPLVENPPLAHALYRAVEVGQAIPAKLYTAVAEILAFVFRAQQRANQSGGVR